VEQEGVDDRVSANRHQMMDASCYRALGCEEFVKYMRRQDLAELRAHHRRETDCSGLETWEPWEVHSEPTDSEQACP
jgi:hypothetical protein